MYLDTYVYIYLSTVWHIMKWWAEIGEKKCDLGKSCIVIATKIDRSFFEEKNLTNWIKNFKKTLFFYNCIM